MIQRIVIHLAHFTSILPSKMSTIPKASENVISFDPHKTMNTFPTWSHITSSRHPSRFITTAGIVGTDETGKVPNSLDAEIEKAFDNLRRCLDAAGASIQDIQKLVYYVVNFDPTNPRHSKHLKSFLNGHRPAVTLVPVSSLANPSCHFEVEAYASIRQEQARHVDVVVVGAGLSGLQAATDLQVAGVSCLVVEARDRVGGKTLTLHPQGSQNIVDGGAAWINDTTQSEVFALTRLLGLKTVTQRTDGNVVQEDLDGGISSFPYGSTPAVCFLVDLW
jgi:monoamine oxidase